MLRIGLIDNYPIARKGLGLLLEVNFQDIHIWDAKNTAELQKRFGNREPDIIILSNNVKQRSHFVSEMTVCKATFHDSRMVVVDETYQPGNSAFYLQSGVMGHLLKGCPASEVVNCIKSVAQNKYFLSTRLHSLALDEMRDISPINWRISPIVMKNTPLTARELQIAFYLCQGKGTSYIAKLIRKAPSQVSGIKGRILKKMNVDNVPDLATIIERHHLQSLATV